MREREREGERERESVCVSFSVLCMKGTGTAKMILKVVRVSSTSTYKVLQRDPLQLHTGRYGLRRT